MPIRRSGSSATAGKRYSSEEKKASFPVNNEISDGDGFCSTDNK